MNLKVYRPRDYVTEELEEVEVPTAIGFTDGAKQIDANDKKAFCRQDQYTDGLKFWYVKVAHNGILYDPWGAFSEREYNKKHNELGRAMWEFHKCSENVFASYLKFLQTRNSAHLIRAQRLYNEEIV